MDDGSFGMSVTLVVNVVSQEAHSSPATRPCGAIKHMVVLGAVAVVRAPLERR